MNINLSKNNHKSKKTYKNPAIEARRRLNENLPYWLKDGWTLNPVIIKNVNNEKICKFLTESGMPGDTRLVVKSAKDLDMCNALLGINEKYAILDIDDPEKLKLPSDFPKPFLIVKTGKGYHLYFHNGDFTGSHKLSGGELQCKTMGVFMPGSYHPVVKRFYEVIEENQSTDKLFLKHIRLFLLKSSKEKPHWTKGNRNNTLNNLIYADLSKNQGRNIPDIIETAKSSGLSKTEILNTSLSATNGALSNGIDPGPEYTKNAVSQITYLKKKEADFKINAEPRLWLNEERIFIEGRPNQCTGDAGVGKSTFVREYGYKLWQKGKTVLLFCQEDDEKEDISPWLIDKGHKDGDTLKNFHVFTDWEKHPVEETLKKFLHITNKFIVIDPVHSLFKDITKPKECRTILMNIIKNLSAHKDTFVYINHPKNFWKEQKLSGSEINSGTKQLGQICRGCTLIKHDADTGLNIVEHTKRQLTPTRYSFNLVEDHIKNKSGKICSFAKIESFTPLKNKPGDTDSILPAKKNLSSKREKIRNELRAVTGPKNKWVTKLMIKTALMCLDLKEWELDRELSLMTQEGLLMRKSEGTKRLYKFKI